MKSKTQVDQPQPQQPPKLRFKVKQVYGEHRIIDSTTNKYLGEIYSKEVADTIVELLNNDDRKTAWVRAAGEVK